MELIWVDSTSNQQYTWRVVMHSYKIIYVAAGWWWWVLKEILMNARIKNVRKKNMNTYTCIRLLILETHIRECKNVTGLFMQTHAGNMDYYLLTPRKII